MHPAFSRVDHRPWPLPAHSWAWRQTWLDLLFAHWPVPASALRPLVPSTLQVQEREGTSWVGVVPFRMAGVTLRGCPSVPGLSAFPELNLRLYVERDERPGVWFISLDARNPIAVWSARRFFHLPYFWARMRVTGDGDGIRYSSERRSGARSVFRGSYAPTSDPYEAKPGSLEHFLTERYCMYAQSPDGGLWRADVHHRSWPLQRASLSIEQNTVGDAQGIQLTGPPALLHFARSLDVVVWKPERVA